MHKLLAKVAVALVYALPAVLFCSYHPIISLGSNASMNFELSLPLIWLVIFDLIAFALLPSVVKAQRRAKLDISDRRFFLFALFPFYATLSIFWSFNPLRAILTAGIIWLVFFAVFALLFILPRLALPKNFKYHLLASFFVSSAVVCGICWLQSILDLSGVSRDTTLLCLGCTSYSFGFPHPSGLAIEPQFMGNLLLAPTLTALYLSVFRKEHYNRKQRLWLAAFASLFSATLFLTFSRGAIYAYATALVVLFIFAIRRRHLRPSLLVIPVATFIFTLLSQGIMAELGPTTETFTGGVTKAINHLSLGIIDLRPKFVDPCPMCDAEAEDWYLPEANFSGYVAESTTVRVNLSTAAIDTWLSAPGHPESNLTIGLRCLQWKPCTASGQLTPTSVLFGVGLGGAGTALYRNEFITGIGSPKEIVQNEFFSLLLELGLVGIMLVVFSLLLAFCPQIFPAKFRDGKQAINLPSFWQHPALPLLLALIIAYLVTLNFFSGLPNALQIYLMPPLLYLILQNRDQSTSTRE